jgi:hypothetical protein
MACRIEYYNDISIYQIGQYIQSDCADITFLNTGTSNVNVNGIVLLPNQSLAFNANFNEIDTTKYSIFFSGTGANSCTVIRKMYKS